MKLTMEASKQALLNFRLDEMAIFINGHFCEGFWICLDSVLLTKKLVIK